MNDFLDLGKLDPSIQIAASYGTTDNFTGQVVPGYLRATSMLARSAAEALVRIQQKALIQGLSLKIFDGYRPVKAVSFFLYWAEKAEDNPHLKALYYPDFERKELFEQGYLARRSSHSRGSAVDLTLTWNNLELDMGGRFDFFHENSNTYSPSVTVEQAKNRRKLIELMESEGFENYEMEWWHFTFRNEAHPETYFDFDII